MKTDATLTRLRRANPEPVAPNVDPGNLFAEITALPQERPSARRRRGLVLAVSFALMVIVASTAYAVSNWVFHSAVEPPVTRREYREAQSRLVLPPGYTWPSMYIPANSVTSPGAGGSHAVLAAQNLWECYWVKAIRTGDAAAQRRSHAMLLSLLQNNMVEAPVGAPEDWIPSNPPSVPFAVFAHDGGLDWIRQTYALAAAGRPQRLEQSCRANTPG
jgi:hypothetical protein